ncbi:hypothetical protein KDA_70270 [Dictyobacter alpinus]|uniref:Uncharacterized protein n=1 Tax=Dictyobacter alpinus TaxID=2014873 RepID=A0A402BJM8_9CHLR|nr:hypothetical protein [Dictyobacter alpinus]GCE31543.1 hypothetical protein KDA_70270 [Dictyobacter alpinus]
MSVFEQLKNLFMDDLQALRQLKKHGWFVWPMERVVKQEHLGRCCYLAEELLSEDELQQMKAQLALSNLQWHSLKTKVSGDRHAKS